MATEIDLERKLRLAEAYADLESTLCDIDNMAHLVWDTVSAAIEHDDSDLTGNPDFRYVTWRSVDKTMFACGHLLSMISDAKEKYHATLKSKQVQK